MKKMFFRATALALSLILTFGPAASASWAMGSKTHVGTTHLAEGVDYTRQYLWSATYSDLRTERYIEYKPNDLVRPVVSFGNSILSKNTLSSMASALEAGGKRVIGGINGDYFVVSTGAPLGLVVTDGILRSSASSHYALGFDAEGNAFIGKPELSITATINGHTLSISGGLNKVRSSTGGYVLYTADFASTTSHTAPGIDVILTPSIDKLGQSVEVDLEIENTATSSNDSTNMDNFTGAEPDSPIISSEQSAEELENLLTESTTSDTSAEGIRDTLVYTDVPIIGGRLSCSVEQVLHSTGSIAIPEGKLVLSIHGKGDEWLASQLTALQAGDIVEIDITAPEEQWETAVSAVGGLYKLVTNGQAESDLDAGQAPRTAVGIRADGSTVFYTVDGRQSGYSVGASMVQVAKRLVELGCVEAVCMDGGGSTTLGATLPGQGSFSLLSRPSDGTERTISNALFLVADQRETGPAEQLSINPGDAIVFSGTKLRLSAIATDRLGLAVTRYNNTQISYSIPAESGTISNGLFVAGDQAGTYTLEATADGLTGTSQITVIPSPDSLSLRNSETEASVTALAVSPGNTIRLTANAMYRNLPMACRNEDFTWTISDNIGTIDRYGNYTVGNRPGTGTITVTAGECAVVIPVTVTGYIRTLQDFEGDFLDMGGSPTAQIEPETRSAYIRFGKQSAKLTYNTIENMTSAVSVVLPLSAQDRYLSLWIYGDGSGNTLSMPVHTNSGTATEVTLATLDFTGWKQITVLLPADSSQILSLKINPSGTVSSGTVWLDQATVSNQILTDHTAPDISLTLSESSLLAELTDNMNTGFLKNQVSVTYDGVTLDFELDGTTVSAQLPKADGLAHRVTVTVSDASGNLTRSSVDISATTGREYPFADTDGHWAAAQVAYLYDRGIITGVTSDKGTMFYPNNAITRGEFAVMVSRWLALDLTQYEGIVLPFADTDSIPVWMLNAVKAMYALGYMQGSAGVDGLYILATDSITRAEAVTLLSRIQAKGYAAVELTFHDTDTIPSWALDAVSTLVAQGAVGGNNNYFYPGNTITRAEMAKILSVLW